MDRNAIRFFPSCLKHMLGLKLIIYDHNPCCNAAKVAKGVRRFGRWSKESLEPKKRFEKVLESKYIQSTSATEANPEEASHVEATTSLM